MIGRVLTALFLALPTAGLVFAQENGSGGEGGPYDTLGPLKVTNTVIFAVIIGYYIYKKAPAFFNARSADIQKAIRDATGLKMEADLRYSEIDRRMATLSDEVKRLRDEAAAEMEREYRRRQQEMQEDIRRIQLNADAQIGAFRHAGMRSLKDYAADAAIDRAARRITEATPQQAAESYVQEFTTLVGQQEKTK
jgi:F0F1-type ATP synthase membrane subunit b/b'